MKLKGLPTVLSIAAMSLPTGAVGASGETADNTGQHARTFIEAIPEGHRFPGHDALLDRMRAHLENLDKQKNSLPDMRQRQKIQKANPERNTGSRPESDNSTGSQADRNAREREAMQKAFDALPSEVLADEGDADSRDIVLRVVCGGNLPPETSLEVTDNLSEIRDVLCPPG